MQPDSVQGLAYGLNSLKDSFGVQCIAALGNVTVEVDGLDAPLDALEE